MKLLLLILVVMPMRFASLNNDAKKTGTQSPISAKNIVGQWKRIAGGEDANKNRILEATEKMKLEPGAQDNLHFLADGKCKVFGMGMEVEGTYDVKVYKGKITILIYTSDIADLPREDRDRSAMRFEIILFHNGKLVVIPPIFAFMLSEYSKSN